MRKITYLIIVVTFILAVTAYAQYKKGSITRAYNWGRSVGSGKTPSYSPFTPLKTSSSITYTPIGQGSYFGSDGNRYTKTENGSHVLQERGASVQFTSLGGGDYAGSDGSHFTYLGNGDYHVSYPNGYSVGYTHLGDGSYHGSDGSSYVNLGDGRYVYFKGGEKR